jgi:hypothetical protein
VSGDDAAGGASGNGEGVIDGAVAAFDRFWRATLDPSVAVPLPNDVDEARRGAGDRLAGQHAGDAGDGLGGGDVAARSAANGDTPRAGDGRPDGDRPGAGDGHAGGDDGRGATSGQRRGTQQLRSSLLRLVDLQVELAQRVFDAQMELFSSVLTDQPRRPAPLERLESSAPAGSSASVELWFHTVTAAQVGPVRFVAGPLTSDQGWVVPASAVTFSSSGQERVRSGDTAATTVTVAVPPAAPSGRYHGFLFVAGCPDVAAHLVLDVVGPSSRPEGSTASARP